MHRCSASLNLASAFASARPLKSDFGFDLKVLASASNVWHRLTVLALLFLDDRRRQSETRHRDFETELTRYTTATVKL